MKTLEVTIISIQASEAYQYKLQYQGKVESDPSVDISTTPTFELPSKLVPFAIVRDGKEMLHVVVLAVKNPGEKAVNVGQKLIEMHPGKDAQHAIIHLEKGKDGATIDATVEISYVMVKLTILDTIQDNANRLKGLNVHAEFCGVANTSNQEVMITLNDDLGHALGANKVTTKLKNVFIQFSTERAISYNVVLTEGKKSYVQPVQLNSLKPITMKYNLEKGGVILFTFRLLIESVRCIAVVHELKFYDPFNKASMPLPNVTVDDDGNYIVKSVYLEDVNHSNNGIDAIEKGVRLAASKDDCTEVGPDDGAYSLGTIPETLKRNSPRASQMKITPFGRHSLWQSFHPCMLPIHDNTKSQEKISIRCSFINSFAHLENGDNSEELASGKARSNVLGQCELVEIARDPVNDSKIITVTLEGTINKLGDEVLPDNKQVMVRLLMSIVDKVRTLRQSMIVQNNQGTFLKPQPPATPTPSTNTVPPMGLKSASAAAEQPQARASQIPKGLPSEIVVEGDEDEDDDDDDKAKIERASISNKGDNNNTENNATQKSATIINKGDSTEAKTSPRRSSISNKGGNPKAPVPENEAKEPVTSKPSIRKKSIMQKGSSKSDEQASPSRSNSNSPPSIAESKPANILDQFTAEDLEKLLKARHELSGYNTTALPTGRLSAAGSPRPNDPNELPGQSEFEKFDSNQKRSMDNYMKTLSGFGGAEAMIREELIEKQKIIDQLLKDNELRASGIEECGKDMRALREENVKLINKLKDLEKKYENKLREEKDALLVIEQGDVDYDKMPRPALIHKLLAVSQKFHSVDKERQELYDQLAAKVNVEKQLEQVMTLYNVIQDAHMQQSKYVQRMQVDQKKIDTYRETIQLQEKVIGKMQALTEARMGTKIKGDNLLDKLYASLEREKNGEPQEDFGDNLSDTGTQTDLKESKNTGTAMSPRPSPRAEQQPPVVSQAPPSDNEIALEKKVKRLEQELQEQEELMESMKKKYQKQISDLEEMTSKSPRESILDENEAMKKVYVLEAEIVSKEYRIKALEDQLQKTAENASREVERMRFKLLTFDSSGLSDEEEDIEESPRPKPTASRPTVDTIASNKIVSGSASKAVVSLREEKKPVEPIQEVPKIASNSIRPSKVAPPAVVPSLNIKPDVFNQQQHDDEDVIAPSVNIKSAPVPAPAPAPSAAPAPAPAPAPIEPAPVPANNVAGGGSADNATNPETQVEPDAEEKKERMIKLALKDEKNEVTGQLTLAFAMYFQPSKKCYKFQLKRLSMSGLKAPSSRMSFTSPRLSPIVKFDFPPLGWTFSTEELPDIGGKNYSKFFPDDEMDVQFDCSMDQLQGDSMYITAINAADKKAVGKTKLTMF